MPPTVGFKGLDPTSGDGGKRGTFGLCLLDGQETPHRGDRAMKLPDADLNRSFLNFPFPSKVALAVKHPLVSLVAPRPHRKHENWLL